MIDINGCRFSFIELDEEDYYKHKELYNFSYENGNNFNFRKYFNNLLQDREYFVNGDLDDNYIFYMKKLK